MLSNDALSRPEMWVCESSRSTCETARAGFLNGFGDAWLTRPTEIANSPEKYTAVGANNRCAREATSGERANNARVIQTLPECRCCGILECLHFFVVAQGGWPAGSKVFLTFETRDCVARQWQRFRLRVVGIFVEIDGRALLRNVAMPLTLCSAP